MAEKEATYRISLDSNTADVSKAAEAELAKFGATIEKSSAFVKEMQGNLRNLRGTSDEVGEAKAALKARIEEERAAISKATLAIQAHGKTYGKLVADQKKASAAAKEAADKAAKLAEREKELTSAQKAAGEPLKKLGEGFDNLGAKLTTSNGLMGLALVGGVALAAALVDLGMKAAGAVVDVVKFTVANADLARSMGLQREAASGSAENSKAWGEQIDALARKVPTSVAKLNELSISLSKSLSGGQSKAGGQTMVDTFNAVAQASSAMGDDAGAALQGIIEEGRRFGRVGLDPSTLQGKWNTGWEDISKAVAKNLGVSLKDAKVALAQHRVTIDAGAKAIRDAVEKRFGEINEKKLISLDSLSTKLHDNWVNLTKGFNLDPILEGLKKVVDLFDVTHVEGYALKELFSDLGKELGLGMDDGVSLAETAIDEFIIALQDLELWYLHNKKGMKEAFDSMGGMDAIKDGVVTLKDAVVDLATAVGIVVKGFIELKKMSDIATDPNKARAAGQRMIDQGKAGKVDTADAGRVAGAATYGAAKVALMMNPIGLMYEANKLGNQIADGLVKGIAGGAPDVNQAMVDTVAGGITAARGPAGADAHSPSRKGLQLGGDITGGIAGGVAGGQGDVDRAMTNVVQMPRAGGGSGGGAGPVHIEVTINVEGGNGDTARALSAPGFLAELTGAIRQALATQGVPTQGKAA